MKLEDLIPKLEAFRNKHGGEAQVLVPMLHGDSETLFSFDLRETAVGKSNKYKLVSRGGNPCLVIDY